MAFTRPDMLYNVHMMAYKVAEARAAFGDLLDAAERGEEVVIERHGVAFTLQPHRAGRRTTRRPAIESVDASLLGGQWTWVWGKDGVRLRSRGTRT